MHKRKVPKFKVIMGALIVQDNSWVGGGGSTSERMTLLGTNKSNHIFQYTLIDNMITIVCIVNDQPFTKPVYVGWLRYLIILYLCILCPFSNTLFIS